MQHLDLIRHNFIAKASHFARLIPGMSIEETAELVRIDSGLPSDTFNAAVIKKPDFTSIQAVLNYYQNKNFPAAVWVWASPESDQIEQQLIDLQLVCNETNIGMWADVQHISTAPLQVADFTIQLVTTAEDLHAYADVLARLFEPSDEANQIRVYYKSIYPYYQSNIDAMQFYIGIHQERVVATGTLYKESDTVGIYDIATSASERGKGFGSKMFQYLLQMAKNQGAMKAVLQASPDGLGIYKKAGFNQARAVKVFENRHLLK